MDTCQKHNEPLMYEPGGHDMPTVLGRTYCRSCSRELVAALAGLTTQEVVEVGDVPEGSDTPSPCTSECESDVQHAIRGSK